MKAIRSMTRSIFLLWLCMFPTVAYFQVKFEAAPNWVNTDVTFQKLGAQPESSGYNLLVLDRQRKVSSKERYTHLAYELLTPDGIQENSPITVNYDPSYQKVVFHQIDIIRDGQRIDRMKQNYFSEINREESLERHLYNGLKTVVVNLPDIRIGDILEYAYSIKGNNPFFSTFTYGEYYMEYSLPVENLYFRILYPFDLNLQWDIDDSLSNFKERIIGTETERTWEKKSVKALNFERNVPSWYDPRARISFSSLEEWKALSSFMADHYKTSKSEEKELKNQLSKLGFKDNSRDNLRSLIRFVQDDVRYLGFEDGISAFKPHSPVKVLQQRFGDCKDKSLLLVEMMKALDVRAQALLVSTTRGQILSDLEVSPAAFDHCVMRFEHNNEWIYVDPTINGQAGDLENIYFPPYQSALVIDKQGDIINLEDQDPALTLINEEIVIDSIGGGMSYIVTTTYNGSQADYQRDLFASSDQSEIQQNYLNWYKNVHPYIRIKDSLTFKTYSNEGQSRFETRESYVVDSAWIDDGNGLLNLELYQIALEPLVNFDRKTERRMPMYVGREAFEQTVNIRLPEKWNAGNDKFEVKGDGYQMRFTSKYSSILDMLTLQYNYQRDSTYISADKVDAFTKDHKAMMENLAYSISYNPAYLDAGFNWPTLTLAVIFLAFSIYLVKRLYFEYDPYGKSNTTRSSSIGSWLILPLIGLFLTLAQTFYLLFVDFNLLDKGHWTAIWDLEVAGVALAIVELFYNLFILSFLILLIILFLKRRTSLPKLIAAFYAITIVITWLDILVASEIYDTKITQTDMKIILQTVIRAGIWIPIFLISERVSNTFVNRLTESIE